MADPRRTSTRRAVLSYSQVKAMNPKWPELQVKDYQGILQDFSFTADELDSVEGVTLENKEAIVGLELRVATLEYRVYTLINATESLVSGPFQMIICKNASPIEITLDTNAVKNDEVHIKRRGEQVTVIGLIDGSNDQIINVLNWSSHYVFDGTDWSSI